MTRTLLAAAAAFALAAPAASYAQDTVVADAEGNVYVMTDSQQAMHDAWPSERQVIYDAWPPDYQTYFWTLTPAQQNGWWVLKDDQRAKVYAMTPEQRAAAWTSIVAQLNGNATAAAATSTAKADGRTPRLVANAVVQTTPANQSSDYPICKGKIQDHCIQPRAAGKNWGNRPLPYWPGHPASEG